MVDKLNPNDVEEDAMRLEEQVKEVRRFMAISHETSLISHKTFHETSHSFDLFF